MFVFKKNKGQAVIEYILILTVAVVILGGLLLRFNKAFQEFGESLVGAEGYYACLLQTGKLPGQSTNCSKEKKDFDPDLNIGNKNSSAGGGGGNSSGSSSGSSSSGASSGDDGSSNASSDPSDSENKIDSSSKATRNSKSSSKKGKKSRASASRGGYNPSGNVINVNNESVFGGKALNSKNNKDRGGSSSSGRRRKKIKTNLENLITPMPKI